MIRPLHVIATEISDNWVDPKTGASKVYFGAVPYLDAMRYLSAITDNYYNDSGKDVVIYFLSNAATWRGEVAKRVKAELKTLIK
jgi:hypothetical protein